MTLKKSFLMTLGLLNLALSRIYYKLFTNVVPASRFKKHFGKD